LLLAEGGNQFLIDEGVATLTTLLNADDQEQDGRLAWQVNLISIKNGRALSMNIDATSGEILEVRTVP
ncbi:MAG: PepSY domain-containing protein, partial [Chloroflexi bacterium]|nr:PepSY domain-containing protein [Chloroflexota bacterium]